MIDQNLLTEFENASRDFNLKKLNDVDRDAYLARVSQIYLSDTDAVWWWQALSVKSKKLSYSNEDDFETLLKVTPKSTVYLVITDDEPSPWPVFVGSITDACAVLRNCRFFEYFISDGDAEWVIFDTHMNELILCNV